MSRMQPSRYPLVSADHALATILGHTRRLNVETVALSASFGRVLAEAVASAENLPPFAASSVDGYAVIAADESASREVLAEIVAGHGGAPVVRPGTAARIMTGAPLPPGADAVVMVEDTSEAAERVTLTAGVRAGENVRPVGVDVALGQTVLAAGTTLGAPEIGLLAALGHGSATVVRRARVAILATGDELVEAGSTPGASGIRDSNGPSLVAAVLEAGGVPVPLGIAKDDEAAQRDRIEEGLRVADVLLTSGGVSVGSRDLIKPILEGLGTVHFGRVAVKPGKPLTFATVGDRLAFGLPGFPVSTLVTFEAFVRPALRKLQGCAEVGRPSVEVTLEHDVRPSPDRMEYQRAVVRYVGGKLVARTTGAQVSSRLLSMVGANALLVVQPGEATLPAGETLPALLTGQVRT